jgi:hypothetical protein
MGNSFFLPFFFFFSFSHIFRNLYHQAQRNRKDTGIGHYWKHLYTREGYSKVARAALCICLVCRSWILFWFLFLLLIPAAVTLDYTTHYLSFVLFLGTDSRASFGWTGSLAIMALSCAGLRLHWQFGGLVSCLGTMLRFRFFSLHLMSLWSNTLRGMDGNSGGLMTLLNRILLLSWRSMRFWEPTAESLGIIASGYTSHGVGV